MSTEKSIPPILASLQADLDYYTDFIRGIARDVLDLGASKYPIFIAWQGKDKPVMGKTVLEGPGLGRVWSINATLLEELVKRKVVQEDKIKLFRSNFKDPEEFMCVLAIYSDDASYIFKAYTKDEAEEID